jgi:hypothetical protein
MRKVTGSQNWLVADALKAAQRVEAARLQQIGAKSSWRIRNLASLLSKLKAAGGDLNKLGR